MGSVIDSHPLFSVLIANYNNGKYLQEAIDSVLGQTYANWEVVLVDDMSTDGSQIIYDKYAEDPRFHIYYNDVNKGCGYSKRRCLDLAKGEICGFLDPDDTLECVALEVMVHEYMIHGDVSLVYSRCYIADAHLNVLEISRHQCALPEGWSFLEYGRGAISQFAAFKRKVYEQTEGINPTYKRAVDHALYFLLEEKGKVLFVDEPLYYYRVNTGNNISIGSNSNAAFLWDLLVMADACRRRGLDVESVVGRRFKEYMECENRIAASDGESRGKKRRASRLLDQHIAKAKSCRMQHKPWLGEFFKVLLYTPFSVRKGVRGMKRICSSPL